MHAPIDLIVHREHPPLVSRQVLCFYRLIALVFGRMLDKEMRKGEKGEREREEKGREIVREGETRFLKD